MKKETSFLSEHSCEFVLVPQLVSILEQKFNHVIPLYFWASREGGRNSLESLNLHSFKILVMYARRPKINYVGASNIKVKLSQLLFERCRAFEKSGIPVIAGIPLIGSLFDLRLNAPCVWLKLNSNGGESEFVLDIKSPKLISDSAFIVQTEDLKNIVERECDIITGEQAITIMRMAKNGFHQGHWHSMFNDLYKPVYILIKVTE